MRQFGNLRLFKILMRLTRTSTYLIFFYFKIIYSLHTSQTIKERFTRIIKIYLIFEYLINYLWHGHHLLCCFLDWLQNSIKKPIRKRNLSHRRNSFLHGRNSFLPRSSFPDFKDQFKNFLITHSKIFTNKPLIKNIDIRIVTSNEDSIFIQEFNLTIFTTERTGNC